MFSELVYFLCSDSCQLHSHNQHMLPYIDTINGGKLAFSEFVRIIFFSLPGRLQAGHFHAKIVNKNCLKFSAILSQTNNGHFYTQNCTHLFQGYFLPKTYGNYK